jgi:predicted RNase H-like HicB family nuclease
LTVSAVSARSRFEGYNTWGKTYEEAIKHAEETLTLYLESFDELGKSIPEIACTQ